MNITIIMPLTVTAVGVYLLIRLRFFFIVHPIQTAKEFASALADRSSRRAFFLALAGTLGVGNIFGVSAGIMIGGAGSLFWLFISSFFAMIIKYAETLLVFDVGCESGGMASVISKVFSRFGRIFAYTYAAFSILLAFFMGSAMQSAAFTDISDQALGINPVIGGIILVILLIPTLIGGARKIENVTEIVIPLTTIIYIMMCFCTILINISNLDEAIDMIFSSAFNVKSILGGGLSFVAIREGFSRGILSNEAGVGTSAMAHSRAPGRSPHIAGLFAMCEVVFDSSLLCLLTGLSILVSLPDITAYTTPMSLINATFSSSLGSFSSVALTVIILAFAYSTIICWYYYGMEYSRLYFGKFALVYPFLFLFFVIASALFSSKMILFYIDFLLLVMSFLTLSAMLKRRHRIAELCPLLENKKSRH